MFCFAAIISPRLRLLLQHTHARQAFPAHPLTLLRSQPDRPSKLVRLGRILKARQDVRVRTTFDAVDKVGHLREEWIVVVESVTFLDIVTGATQVEDRRVVRVDETHLEAVTVNLELTRVSGALKSDGMNERANGTRLVLPRRCRHARNALLFRDLAFVDWDLAERSRSLIPFDRVRNDRGDIDIATKVSRKVAEMRGLLDNGTHVDTLVPPSGLGDRLVGGSVASHRAHDGQVVFGDDLLHLLNAAEVAKHVTDRDNVAGVDECAGDLVSLVDGASRDGLHRITR